MTERTGNNHKAVADKERFKAAIHQALKAREAGEGIFAQEIVAPEVPFIKLTKSHGEKIGSEPFPLHAVFFLTSTLFADNSWRQLARVSKPESFLRYAWLFQPQAVVARSSQEVVAAATDYIRPSQNKAAITKWQHNAQVIMERYGGDLRNLFAEHNLSASKIKEVLVGPKSKTSWEGFHRFGPKLATLFLQWVHQYNLAPLKDSDRIGIPVDFQVARILIQIKAINLSEQRIHKEHVQNGLIELLITEICQEEGWLPHEVSEMLWLIGSIACNNKLHDLCPLADYCDRLISRDPYTESGIFDLTDTGRHETTKTPTAQHLRSLAAGQLRLPLE